VISVHVLRKLYSNEALGASDLEKVREKVSDSTYQWTNGVITSATPRSESINSDPGATTWASVNRQETARERHLRRAISLETRSVVYQLASMIRMILYHVLVILIHALWCHLQFIFMPKHTLTVSMRVRVGRAKMGSEWFRSQDRVQSLSGRCGLK
jgi:hypothetical protein